MRLSCENGRVFEGPESAARNWDASAERTYVDDFDAELLYYERDL
jgi:hypothetical protein